MEWVVAVWGLVKGSGEIYIYIYICMYIDDLFHVAEHYGNASFSFGPGWLTVFSFSFVEEAKKSDRCGGKKARLRLPQGVPVL